VGLRRLRELLGLDEWPSLEEWLRMAWEAANTFIDDMVRVMEWIWERLR